jgi:hypothetical protein
MKAAIYHFTDGKGRRPSICQGDLCALSAYAHQLGYTEADVYCDTTSRKTGRTEFDRLLEHTDDYDALVVKDFYHISRHTEVCVKILKQLHSQGVKIYSTANGAFSIIAPPVDKPLKIATYTCGFGTSQAPEQAVSLRAEIFKTFTADKTRWKITAQYADISRHQNDGEQLQLQDLIRNRRQYDLLLVMSFGELHWRTANCLKIRKQLGLGIYSLQDGYIPYGRT